MNNSKRSKGGGDEVEQLLQAAQDEVLLKLSVDSHTSRLSPDYLLADLDRRFQALKSRPSSSSSIPNFSSTKTPNTSIVPPPEQQPQPGCDGDDLLARFAALKASSSTSSSSAGFHLDHGDWDEEEDEVEKIIRWAKDAARLDPSPPSDDDDDDDDAVDDTDSDTTSEDEDRVDKRKKGEARPPSIS